MNIKETLRNYLDLGQDKLEDTQAVEAIVQGVQFKGASLWILVCAVFIASLGLNMNSTAVIIGAMLISPLMGPIMGIGLGLGINDSQLIIRCVKNLAVATLFALLTSAIYFWISPLNDARSELLARTQPTLYDVLIAFFGGFAGIIATGSKSKGNILPGVAIATALMPPLCTAGYGIATAQWQFFFGAFYLFLINAVYIGLATWMGCLILGLPKVNAPGKAHHRTLFATIVLLVLIAPSAFTTYGLIKQDVLNGKVSTFVHKEFESLPEIRIVNHRYVEPESETAPPYIEVAIIGKQMEQEVVDVIAAHMSAYDLPADCQLKVLQASSGQEIQGIQYTDEMTRTMVETYQGIILNLQHQNDSLREVIRELTSITQEQDSI